MNHLQYRMEFLQVHLLKLELQMKNVEVSKQWQRLANKVREFSKNVTDIDLNGRRLAKAKELVGVKQAKVGEVNGNNPPPKRLFPIAHHTISQSSTVQNVVDWLQ